MWNTRTIRIRKVNRHYHEADPERSEAKAGGGWLDKETDRNYPEHLSGTEDDDDEELAPVGATAFGALA